MSITAIDDLFHTPPDDHYTWSETNWFGLMFIPEKRLQFDLYAWFHPNIKVAYSGFYASRGRVVDQLCAEYFDYRSWLPMPCGNLDKYSLDNGMSVEILEPLKVYKLDYVDHARDTILDVVWTAIMPPVPFPMGEHLEQAGRVTGDLRLNGENHKVDCLVVRDRSWVHRTETPKLGRKPVNFVACVFDESTAICLTVPNSSYLHGGNSAGPPAWLNQAEQPTSEFVPFCWIFRDGVHRQVKAAELRVKRDQSGWYPVNFSLNFTDDAGEEYRMTGIVENFFPLRWMQNNIFTCCLSRFSWGDKHAWGSYSEMMEQDVVRSLMEGISPAV